MRRRALGESGKDVRHVHPDAIGSFEERHERRDQRRRPSPCVADHCAQVAQHGGTELQLSVWKSATIGGTMVSRPPLCLREVEDHLKHFVASSMTEGQTIIVVQQLLLTMLRRPAAL